MSNVAGPDVIPNFKLGGELARRSLETQDVTDGTRQKSPQFRLRARRKFRGKPFLLLLRSSTFPSSSPTLWINVPTLSLFWLLGVKLVSRRCTASPTFLYCNLPCKLLLPLEQQYSPCPERIRYTVIDTVIFSRDDSFLIGNFFFSPFLFSLPFVGNFSFVGSDGNLFLFVKKKK